MGKYRLAVTSHAILEYAVVVARTADCRVKRTLLGSESKRGGVGGGGQCLTAPTPIPQDPGWGGSAPLFCRCVFMHFIFLSFLF